MAGLKEVTEPGVRAFIRSGTLGVSCDEVIRCVLEISDEGWNIYHFLEQEGAMRVDRVAEFIGKDRSTAYRELQKLTNCGICIKEQATLKEGGYYFLYSARSIEEIKSETERCIDATYAQLKETIKGTFPSAVTSD